MKKLICLALILIMSVMLNGCMFVYEESTGMETATSAQTEETTTSPVSDIDGYEYVEAITIETENNEAVTLDAGYNTLTCDEERECYEQLHKYIYYISEEAASGFYKTYAVVLEDMYLSEAQIRLVISAYFQDHPEAYWTDSRFEYSNATDNTIVQMYSYLSAEDINATNEKAESAAYEILSGIDADADAFEKELYIHDSIITRCEYVDDLDEVPQEYRTYTILGPLVDGEAVCEGYSRSMQLLLSSVGIESYNVLGIGTDELHMWNCVKLADKWYFVDPTWDDDGVDGASYDYFNITTDQLLYDHTISPLYSSLSEDQICGTDDNSPDSFNLFVPECTDESQSFFAHNAVVLYGLNYSDTESICEELRRAAQNKEHKIYLLVDESADYDYVVDNLFYSGDYIFFDCVDSVNDELDSVTIDRDNVSLRKSEVVSLVTVYLEYI
ncbi:MAG: hypothetical protein IJV88_06700 [Ruminococcus sp.]|nr:hypothetical protein [Ruminococcus sp.]